MDHRKTSFNATLKWKDIVVCSVKWVRAFTWETIAPTGWWNWPNEGDKLEGADWLIHSDSPDSQAPRVVRLDAWDTRGMPLASTSLSHMEKNNCVMERNFSRRDSAKCGDHLISLHCVWWTLGCSKFEWKRCKEQYNYRFATVQLCYCGTT